jgi:pimeloyl-ACP methyl ester carboxylesterase
MYEEREHLWPVKFEPITVNTSYGDTYVRMSGPTRGKPMVLLHGGGSNSLNWAANVTDFSAEYRVFAVDNIYDNGRSVYTRRIQTSYDFVTWLNELFDALGLADDIILVGLSYGGWIAGQYALTHQQRLEKLVLLAPIGTVSKISLSWIIRAVLCAIPHRVFTKRFMYWLLEDLVNKDEQSRAVVDEFVKEGYIAIRSFAPKKLINPTVLSDGELQSIHVPLFILIGEHEKIYADSVNAVIQRLKNVVPSVHTAIIPNAGHDLTLVQTELVNEKILTFLGQQQ